VACWYVGPTRCRATLLWVQHVLGGAAAASNSAQGMGSSSCFCWHCSGGGSKHMHCMPCLRCFAAGSPCCAALGMWGMPVLWLVQSGWRSMRFWAPMGHTGASGLCRVLTASGGAQGASVWWGDHVSWGGSVLVYCWPCRQCHTVVLWCSWCICIVASSSCKVCQDQVMHVLLFLAAMCGVVSSCSCRHVDMHNATSLRQTYNAGCWQQFSDWC
jgi:hypothetical protein